MFILEGPDGAGKSTLARSIERSHGYLIRHEGPPKTKDLLQHYGLTIVGGAPKTIFDRHFLGEHVYGPVMRGVDLLHGAQGLKLMNRLLVGFNVMVLICLPDYEVCLENWRARKGQEYVGQEDKFARVYDRYQELAFRLTNDPFTKPQYMVIDPFKDDLSQLPRLDRANKPMYNKVGANSPRFLFVGEQANHDTLDLAFFSLTGSSRFLNDCLVDAGYQENEMAFVNALTLQNKPINIYELRRITFRPCVVALGGIAESILNAGKGGGRPDYTVPHPAYWRRFKSKERDEYVGELRYIRDRTLRCK